MALFRLKAVLNELLHYQRTLPTESQADDRTQKFDYFRILSLPHCLQGDVLGVYRVGLIALGLVALLVSLLGFIGVGGLKSEKFAPRPK